METFGERLHRAVRERGMVAFGGIDALVETMHDDVRRAREILGVS